MSHRGPGQGEPRYVVSSLQIKRCQNAACPFFRELLKSALGGLALLGLLPQAGTTRTRLFGVCCRVTPLPGVAAPWKGRGGRGARDRGFHCVSELSPLPSSQPSSHRNGPRTHSCLKVSHFWVCPSSPTCGLVPASGVHALERRVGKGFPFPLFPLSSGRRGPLQPFLTPGLTSVSGCVRQEERDGQRGWLCRTL